jgi:hypothetical protein
MKKFAVVLLAVFVLAAYLLLPALAFAQAVPAAVGVLATATTPPPTLTPPVALVLVLSLVIGTLTQMIQTGSVFGLVVTPKAWLPGLTVLVTFLGGVYAYFAGLGAAFAINGTTLVYGISAGIASLIAGSAPGMAVHAHSVTPQNILAFRAAKKAADKAATLPPPAPISGKAA